MAVAYSRHLGVAPEAARRGVSKVLAGTRPSRLTAVMTNLTFDMVEHRIRDEVSYDLRHEFPLS